ncbi:hypothetical protein AB0E96_27815 [Kitasatospora sp. NPDC036755]|uniref:phosphoribosyltransferase-like protein n=1 Tax=Kitasatospora sp. NPDC036755 TaxID=3154600 RepID=UPI0033E07DF4
MDRPSDTAQGSAWIQNFPQEEQRLAELLLNSLQICFDSRIRAELAQVLFSVQERIQMPAVVVPVRELPLPEGADATQDSDSASFFAPLDQPFRPLAGSEGLVGNVIRETLGLYPDAQKVSYPESIDSMRRSRTRSIILVEDFCGTGNRVRGYVNAWMRNKTIRSWHSYGFIRFHLVTFAISPKALQALEKDPRIHAVHSAMSAADFSAAQWTSDETAEIRTLCQKYSRINSMALGYEGCESLFVMQHTVPNNIPAILWQNQARGILPWVPLFKDRRMSPEMQRDWGDYSLEGRVAQEEMSLRRFESAGDFSGSADGLPAFVVEVLEAAERGIRDAERVSRALGLAETRALTIKQLCVRMGLLDARGRLTDAGRRVLAARPQAGGRRKVSLSSGLIASDAPYYPRSLRGVSGV